VFTFGGGVEHRLAPLVRLKLEVRDYVGSTLSRLLAGEGAWHRVAVIGGLVVGK